MLAVLLQGTLSLFADRLRRSRALALGLASSLGLATAASLAALWAHAPRAVPDLPAPADVQVPALRLSTASDDVFLGWAELPEWSSRAPRALPLPPRRPRIAWTPPEPPRQSAEPIHTPGPSPVVPARSGVSPPAHELRTQAEAVRSRAGLAYAIAAPRRFTAAVGAAPMAHEPNEAERAAPEAPTADAPALAAPPLGRAVAAAPPVAATPAPPAAITGRPPLAQPAPASTSSARPPQLRLAAAPPATGVTEAPQPAALSRPAPPEPAALSRRAPSAVPTGPGPSGDRGQAQRPAPPTPVAARSETPLPLPGPAGGSGAQPPVDIALDRGPEPPAMNLLAGLFTASEDSLPVPAAPPANAAAGSPSAALEAIARSAAPVRGVGPLRLTVIPEPATGALLALGLAGLGLRATHARHRARRRG